MEPMLSQLSLGYTWIPKGEGIWVFWWFTVNMFKWMVEVPECGVLRRVFGGFIFFL